jgi:sugar-specific transcriptional regulator TrmB
MPTDSAGEQPVELLQELGLKEYESKCFVGLTRVTEATAKEISEIAEIPRTRVYDAMRVLESRGLVEVHHSTPQQFRAVTVEEAIETLRSTYESRFDELEQHLERLQPVEREPESTAHEVWSLSGQAGITSRSQQLLADADEEIISIVGTKGPLETKTIQRLNQAVDRGVDIYLGALDKEMRARLTESIAGAAVFESELGWLQNDIDAEGSHPAISRVLLIDRNVVLLGSLGPAMGEATERAIFGRGFTNGLLIVLRRILATGLGTEGSLPKQE